MMVASCSSKDIPAKLRMGNFGGIGGMVTLGANGTDEGGFMVI